MGIVKDIVFREGESPNTNHLPEYVLVDFPHYTGPIFLRDKPTYVPITPIKIHCQKRQMCCSKEFIPLQSCYAKTVHTFQGSNVGPTRPGEPDNPIQRIICDPGVARFEGNNPGLLYTIVTRATTMGNGNKMKSALYFDGENMKPDRVIGLFRTRKGGEYKKVQYRRKAVEYLKRHVHNSGMSPTQKEDLLSWIAQTITSQRYGIP